MNDLPADLTLPAADLVDDYIARIIEVPAPDIPEDDQEQLGRLASVQAHLSVLLGDVL
ncbi:hypothetical protein [uncultured Paraglaciecola sp.]|uniref:hypothetical protein n=1 Tax=uncultured Paraglaciecola sp. TaxID=1765024 RepID=UPI0026078E68|nr:hypothetical protein [uncultured Paraglaciecola sp.]